MPFSQGKDKSAPRPNEETGEPPRRQPPEPPQDVPQAACTTSIRGATSATIGMRMGGSWWVKLRDRWVVA